ncbi:cytochrome b-245 chaperone 1-like [Macrobrachium rosenbergii]|uniref:cytochrome b-245 chaperone 1-like n=1 Tax=Macrobrachium rosenbergii TaxID=79674 RepID=UPI0034D62DA2
MNVAFHSRELLHLSIAPGVKSWSVFVGVMSIGVGASYYSPDDHVFMKVAYLTGCLILGLTFLDDWEDCVFDLRKSQIIMTRRNWFEWLTSRCADRNTLVLDTSSVLAVRVLHIKERYKDGYQVGLILRAGGTIPVSETSVGIKSDQDALAKNIQHFLNLERVEPVRNSWADWSESDDDDPFNNWQPPLEVESLKGSGNINFEDIKLGDDRPNEWRDNEGSESVSSSDEEIYDDP